MHFFFSWNDFLFPTFASFSGNYLYSLNELSACNAPIIFPSLKKSLNPTYSLSNYLFPLLLFTAKLHHIFFLYLKNFSSILPSIHPNCLSDYLIKVTKQPDFHVAKTNGPFPVLNGIWAISSIWQIYLNAMRWNNFFSWLPGYNTRLVSLFP